MVRFSLTATRVKARDDQDDATTVCRIWLAKTATPCNADLFDDEAVYRQTYRKKNLGINYD